MTCERCGKHAGEVRYTEYVDGDLRRSLICRSCADELGFAESEKGPREPLATGQVLGVVNVEGILKGDTVLPEDVPRCPSCGSTAADLDDNSLFGCSACYGFFEDSLEALFRRVHGRVRHRGRIPGGVVEGPEEAPADGPTGPDESRPAEGARRPADPDGLDDLDSFDDPESLAAPDLPDTPDDSDDSDDPDSGRPDDPESPGGPGRSGPRPAGDAE